MSNNRQLLHPTPKPRLIDPYADSPPEHTIESRRVAERRHRHRHRHHHHRSAKSREINPRGLASDDDVDLGASEKVYHRHSSPRRPRPSYSAETPPVYPATSRKPRPHSSTTRSPTRPDFPGKVEASHDHARKHRSRREQPRTRTRNPRNIRGVESEGEDDDDDDDYYSRHKKGTTLPRREFLGRSRKNEYLDHPSDYGRRVRDTSPRYRSDDHHRHSRPARHEEEVTRSQRTRGPSWRIFEDAFGTKEENSLQPSRRNISKFNKAFDKEKKPTLRGPNIEAWLLNIVDPIEEPDCPETDGASDATSTSKTLQCRRTRDRVPSGGKGDVKTSSHWMPQKGSSRPSSSDVHSLHDDDASSHNSGVSSGPGSSPTSQSNNAESPTIPSRRSSLDAKVDSSVDVPSEKSRSSLKHPRVKKSDYHRHAPVEPVQKHDTVPQPPSDPKSPDESVVSHNDLITVLSCPHDRTQPERPTRHTGTNKQLLANAAVEEVLEKLGSDEAQYMRELQTLVGGVIPVLLKSILSKDDKLQSSVDQSGPCATPTPTSIPAHAEKLAEPIVKMGTCLRELKKWHKAIPTYDAKDLFAWARGVKAVYRKYLVEWRLCFQHIVIKLASHPGEKTLLDHRALPQDSEGDVVDDNGAKVDVAYLLKRPLVRLKYLAKTLRSINFLQPSEAAGDVANSFQDLVAYARVRFDEEKARLEDEAACCIDTTRAKSWLDLRPLPARFVNISPSFRVQARDPFSLLLEHTNGSRVTCECEVIIREDIEGPSSGGGDLLINDVDEKSGRCLLFPPIQRSSLSAELCDVPSVLELTLWGSHGNGLFRESLRLRATSDAVAKEWVALIGTRPTPPREILAAIQASMSNGHKPERPAAAPFKYSDNLTTVPEEPSVLEQSDHETIAHSSRQPLSRNLAHSPPRQQKRPASSGRKGLEYDQHDANPGDDGPATEAIESQEVPNSEEIWQSLPSYGEMKRATASVFLWNELGAWEPLRPTECAVFVSSGVLVVHDKEAISTDTKTLDHAKPRPLVAVELTSPISIQRGTAIDISVRLSSNPGSLPSTGNTVMFRSRNSDDCTRLYDIINSSRKISPKPPSQQQQQIGAQPFHAESSSPSNAQSRATATRSSSSRPSSSQASSSGFVNKWRNKSYRASQNANSKLGASGSGSAGSSAGTITSAFSALKKFGASKMFNIARSSISPSTKSPDGANHDDASAPADAGDGALSTSIGRPNMNIRLYQREPAGNRWRDMGASRLLILPVARAKAQSPLSKQQRGTGIGVDGGTDEKISLGGSKERGESEEEEGKGMGETADKAVAAVSGAASPDSSMKRIVITAKKSGKTLVDACLGETSFERVARTGIAVSVYEDSGIAKEGGVAYGNFRVYMIQMKSEAEAAYTFGLVGKLRY